MKIYKCKNGHYSIKQLCPICGKNVVECFELRNGDCVACGQLCQDGAYACDKPEPIVFVE